MIISQTPLRISLAGGGTDFEDFWKLEGGSVFGSAIDKYVFVIVKERFDEKIYVNYSVKEIVDRVDDLQHELAREALRTAGITKGVEITFLADIPSEGSGLGSSSSVTVGLLNALWAFKGEFKAAADLAEQACRIEIDILGKPIGKQDQYFAAYGNMRYIRFNPDGSVNPKGVPLAEGRKRLLDSNLLLFFTGRTRRSENILQTQRRNIEYKRVALRRMSQQAWEILEAVWCGEMDDVGRILHEAWLHKKSLCNTISTPDIDALYDRALEGGALGGKIAGAGGGGFLLLYCPTQDQERLRNALSDLRELPFHLEWDGSKIILNMRSRYGIRQSEISGSVIDLPLQRQSLEKFLA